MLTHNMQRAKNQSKFGSRTRVSTGTAAGVSGISPDHSQTLRSHLRPSSSSSHSSSASASDLHPPSPQLPLSLSWTFLSASAPPPPPRPSPRLPHRRCVSRSPPIGHGDFTSLSIAARRLPTLAAQPLAPHYLSLTGPFHSRCPLKRWGKQANGQGGDRLNDLLRPERRRARSGSGELSVHPSLLVVGPED